MQRCFEGIFFILFNRRNIIQRRKENNITWTIFNANSDSLLEYAKAEAEIWKIILKTLIKIWAIHHKLQSVFVAFNFYANSDV